MRLGTSSDWWQEQPWQRQLREIERMTQPFRQFDELLASTRHVEQLCRPLREIEETVGRFKEVGLQVRPTDGLLAKTHEGIRPPIEAGLLDDRNFRASASAAASSAVARYENLGGLATVHDHQARLASLSEAIDPYFSRTSDWIRAISSQVNVLNGIGILACLQEDSNYGLLTWQIPGEGASVQCTPWADEVPNSIEPDDEKTDFLEVDCEVSCSLCGTPLFAKRARVLIDSLQQISISIDVLPLCVTCMRKDEEEPGSFIARSFDLLKGGKQVRPQLILVEGEGQSREPPRGRKILRIVPRISEE